MYDNYNYPCGADNENAPWNQVDVPEKEFDVTCSQSLSKTVTVVTDNYIPGASGVDYEPDDEGGYYASGWQDDDDTSNTDWSSVYEEEHYTPLQLIGMYEVALKNELKSLEKQEKNYTNQMHIRRIKHLIDECSDWVEDDLEIIND